MSKELNEGNRNENLPPPQPPPSPPPFMHTLAVPSFAPQGSYKRLHEEADGGLAPRPSVLLPHLKESEKKFFSLVAAGDVNAVKDYLVENPGFNINCVNFQGVSALLVAVQTKSEPMVEFLLTQKGIDLGDCVLHAVRDNQPKILEMFLDKLQQTAPSLEFVGALHSTDFPDHITPLILAAQCGHFEIIEMLIDRGHTIKKPHSPACRCPECITHLERDDLLHAESLRLNLYRAVSNPAYICHSTSDPILTCFQLSKEMRDCAVLVPEFQAAYLELADEIATFAVDLVAHCRSTGEMELILTQKEGMNSKSFMFPRLVLAMDNKQKTFVAHPNTQQIIETAWHGDWHEYKLKTTFVRMIYPIYRMLIIPFITIMCIVTPSHSLVRHWSIPLNKMISHTAGYIVFLLIIFLESNMEKPKEQKRRPPCSGLEPIIILFVLGYFWSNIRMCLLVSPRRFFKLMWNWHSVVTNVLFLLTFFFWLASYFDYTHNDQVNLERKYWHHLDPLLIAEGTFTLATIMAYIKLLYFCRLNYYLGPLQISLGKMCADISKYISIFTIIIVSFAAGLCRFYQYYDGMVQVDSNGIKTAQVSSFVDFGSTLKTLFWALFCMAPLESADVIIENLPGDTDNSTITNKHDFTEAIGYIAFAMFEFLTVVMILNMLIATMSSTFQRVLDNLNVEWTFGKTDFYLEYMLQTITPPPFNLIPTPHGVSTFMELLPGSSSKGKASKSQCCPMAFKSHPPEDVMLPEPSKLEYPALMTLLVQRYFREKDTDEMAASDMDILKLEIHELKLLLKDIIEGK